MNIDMVAGARLRAQGGDQRIDASAPSRRARAAPSMTRPASHGSSGRCRNTTASASRQRRRQRVGVRAQAHRIGARLHADQDARVADFRAQAGERGRDRGRMVGEIVVDAHAVHLADQFHAPLDAAESGEAPAAARRHRRRRHAPRPARPARSSRCGGRAAASALRRSRAVVRHGERASRRLRAACAPVAALDAEASRPASSSPSPALRRGAHPRALTISRPLPRHGAHQMMELALDRGDVGKDVGVVVFEVVEDRDRRPVVHELRALVEERGVVFVRFDDEIACPSPEPRRHAEIPRHAADQEARLAACRFEQIRQQRWSSWSCRACRPPRARRARPARSRPATAGRRCSAGAHPACARPPDCRATARCRRRPDPASAARCCGVIACMQRDAEPLELGRHRRIHVRVASLRLRGRARAPARRRRP